MPVDFFSNFHFFFCVFTLQLNWKWTFWGNVNVRIQSNDNCLMSENYVVSFKFSNFIFEFLFYVSLRMYFPVCLVVFFLASNFPKLLNDFAECHIKSISTCPIKSYQYVFSYFSELMRVLGSIEHPFKSHFRLSLSFFFFVDLFYPFLSSNSQLGFLSVIYTVL